MRRKHQSQNWKLEFLERKFFAFTIFLFFIIGELSSRHIHHRLHSLPGHRHTPPVHLHSLPGLLRILPVHLRTRHHFLHHVHRRIHGLLHGLLHSRRHDHHRIRRLHSLHLHGHRRILHRSRGRLRDHHHVRPRGAWPR